MLFNIKIAKNIKIVHITITKSKGECIMYKEEQSPAPSDIIIDYIRYRINPEATNKLHKHPHSELVIIATGDMTYTTGGKIVRVGEKSAVYNRAGLIHNPFVKQTPIYERYKIRFYEQDLMTGNAEFDRMITESLSSSYTKALDEAAFEEVFNLARGMSRVKSEMDDSLLKHEYIMSSLRTIILHCAISKEREEINNDGYIADVVEYINKNLHTGLTIEKIANNFFVSKSKLIYDFKAYCNMTINEYITIGRVEKAKDMLSRGYAVVTVAEASGFSSASYFIKVFASLVGTTPLQYQIKHSRVI